MKDVTSMKLRLTKNLFLKSWALAECCAIPGTLQHTSCVLVTAGEDGTALQATDIKTGVSVSAQGVDVIEPGSALLPVRRVSELFAKAPSGGMTLEIKDGGAVLIAGKSRCRFSTYPAEDFPKLPKAGSGEPVFRMDSGEMLRALECGTLCASAKDEFPQYLSSLCLSLNGSGGIDFVSTDKRRVAIYGASAAVTGRLGGNGSVLLPLSGIMGLRKILGASKAGSEVSVSYDGTQAYFLSEGIEFSIRRVEASFPDYKRIIPESFLAAADFDRGELLDALARVDIVVKDYTRTALFSFGDPGGCVISGRAPEFGEAREEVGCSFSGEPIKCGYNAGFLQGGIKACAGASVRFSLSGAEGTAMISSAQADQFLYILAPVNVGNET